MKPIIRSVSRVSLLLPILLALLLAGCKTNPNDDYIQGYWTFANEFNDPQATEVHLNQEWWFGGGRYYFLRELWAGFPETSQGRYRIIDSTEDTLILEFFGVDSNRAQFSDGSQIILELDREHEQLRIGRILYYRSGY